MMSALSQPPSMLEQRAVIRFLTIENVSVTEIHKRLKSAYGNSVMSIQHVRKWRKLFKSGRVCIEDEERGGKPVSVSTNVLMDKVEALIQSSEMFVFPLLKI
ncbi:hypothetical protein PGB90_009663 [Kerria lacca]